MEAPVIGSESKEPAMKAEGKGILDCARSEVRATALDICAE